MTALRIHPLTLSPIVVGTTLVVVASTFGDDEGPVFCLFRRCTGGYCPGCGGSRAVAALVRGDVAGAWALHPWAVVITAQMMIAGALAIAGVHNRVRRFIVPVLLANLTFGLVLWIARLSSGAIPVPFG